MAGISVVNRSNLLSDDACCLIAQTCHVQLRDHVCPAWGRVPVNVDFVPRGRAPEGRTLLVWVDDDPDITGVLGYHSEDSTGVSVGQVFVRPILIHGGGVLLGDLSVAAVVSHEVVESFIDPSCQLWSRRDDGTFVAYEACDPVHGQSYLVATQAGVTSVCDFVMPAWFDSDRSDERVRYDWLDTLGGPFSLGPRGYVSVMSGERFLEHASTGAAASGSTRGRLRSERRRRHCL